MSSVKTPSGFYPLTGELANTLNTKRNELLALYATQEFSLVTCPIINFASSNTSFKFSDSLSQNDLEIIDDLTPQVSNIDSVSSGIKKYCYAQNIVKSQPDDFYSSRSPLQIGAEIYGDNSLDADVQAISLMIDSLKHIGIDTITVALGNISLFNTVIHALGASQYYEELKDIFAAKSLPDLEVLVASHNLSPKLIDFLVIGTIPKGIDDSGEIERMEQLIASIDGITIVIDITDTKTYNYHTGLIFSAYSTQYPKAIARGGRFISEFGRCATGFSFDLQFLLQH